MIELRAEVLNDCSLGRRNTMTSQERQMFLMTSVRGLGTEALSKGKRVPFRKINLAVTCKINRDPRGYRREEFKHSKIEFPKRSKACSG